MAEKYKNPALTTDIALFSVIKNALCTLLIKRKNPPFQDKWAIPGGFVDYEEDIYKAAERELAEETGIEGVNLEQAQTFGTPGRDPRGRTVSVVYFALVNSSDFRVKADTDAKDAKWFDVLDLPGLAFDHEEIISFSLKFLKQKLENTPVVKPLMPAKFTIQQLQGVYEVILNKRFEHKDFEQKIFETGLLERVENSVYKFKNIEFAGKF